MGKNNDIIKITLYGTTEKKNRQEAINDMIFCMSFCDPRSSEYGRYATCLQQLMTGSNNVTDEDY